MTKKSHRKMLDEMNPTPNESDVYKRCIKIGDLINKLFLDYFRVPEGFYRCPKCESQPTLRTSNRLKRNFLPHNGENTFCFITCNICEGTGYIDFVTNATKPWESVGINFLKERIIGFIPFGILGSKDLEIASSVFYNTYDEHKYLGFDIDFKNPELNKKKNKALTQFIGHFIDYKKNRDKRRKFLIKNFHEFQQVIVKKTKISNLPTGKVKCKQCNAKPIDIEYLAFNDTIQIKICGKCYGRGYQSKKDTKAVTGFYLCDASEADYSNKRRMIKGLLTDIELHQASMILNLERIEYEEKQKKLGKKTDYADFMLSRLSAKSRASIDEKQFRHSMNKFNRISGA